MKGVKANPDAELGVLGTLIQEGNPDSLQVKKSMMQLDEKLFYNSSYRELFRLIKKFYDSNHCFDEVTFLTMSLPDDMQLLIEQCIMHKHFSRPLLEHHIEELHRLYELRMQLNILSNTYKECMNEPINTLSIERMRLGIKEAGETSLSRQKQGKSFAEIYLSDLNQEYQGQNKIVCGVKQFETIKNSSLITIAGASGIGKTFFSIYVMDEIARFQSEKQILFFSLEMKCNEIWERYLHIRQARKEDTDQLPKGKVFDQPRIDIEYIETISQFEAINKPISVIVIDYLALVTSKGKYDREDLRLSDITQRLAALAMNLNCIVICLSQVNREVARRNKDDRCPYPHDVADSVGSVRSSSLWIGIDRPEDMNNIFVAKCRKSRYGNNFEAWFDFNNGRFVERVKPFIYKQKVSKENLDEFIGEI